MLFVQEWRNVLFLHWPVAPEHLQLKIPAPIELDTFAGAAWVSVVALRVRATRPFGLAGLGPIGRCVQVNLRTYVKHDGKPGLWFFSVDADNMPMVIAARTALSVPYHHAKLKFSSHGDTSFELEMERTLGYADFWAAWSMKEPMETARGSIDRFLTERYWAYGWKSGMCYRQRFEHPAWSLHRADLFGHRVSVSESAGLPHLEGAPLVHASPGVNAKSFAPQLLGASPVITQSVRGRIQTEA